MAEPEEKFSIGGIQASVFRNVRKVKGKDVELLSVSFQKRYKDGDEWKSTNTLNPSDIPKAMLVLLQAFNYVSEQQGKPVDDEIEVSKD